MIAFIRNYRNLLRTIRILSKYDILGDGYLMGDAPIPVVIKWLLALASWLFYPKNIFFKNMTAFGSRLSCALAELGPIYIKFGQTLSTRPDLIGYEAAKSLQNLQDRMPAFDPAEAKKIICNNLKSQLDEIFLEFESVPVAAASIAQVHKAKLHTGEYVAVKILRPNIRQKYLEDIELLEYGASILTSFMPYINRLKPIEVLGSFKESMKMELNLLYEAAAASRIRDNFASDDSVYIPEIYWKYTTPELLVLQWIDGVSIYDKQAIIDTGHDPKDIAAKIAVMFFNQAYRDGFFHADLHPGNIMVGRNGQIILLDFGIIGILPEDDRLAIAEILYSFLQRDYLRVAKIHHKVGYVPPDTNIEHFAQSCRAIAEPIIGLAVQDISIGNLLVQLFKVTEEYGMETQTQLLFLQKTMVVVEGIGYSLDPGTNMWHLAEPWIKKWAAKNISPEAKLLRRFKKILELI